MGLERRRDTPFDIGEGKADGFGPEIQAEEPRGAAPLRRSRLVLFGDCRPGYSISEMRQRAVYLGNVSQREKCQGAWRHKR